MLVLGLILILGSAALTVGAVYDGGESASVELLGATVDTTVAGVFFTGAGTMLLFLMGVWLLTSSMGRARRRRVERKEVRRRQHDSVARLEEERTQLRAENERLAEQLGTTDTAGTAGTDTAGREVVDSDRNAALRRQAAADESGATTTGTTDTTTGGTHARSDADLRSSESTPTGRSGVDRT
jgi:hypothetical protein